MTGVPLQARVFAKLALKEMSTVSLRKSKGNLYDIWTVTSPRVNQIEPMAAPYKPVTVSDLPAGVPLSVGG